MADIDTLPKAKLTKARARVLNGLVRNGGRATAYDLAYPRSNMMHELLMADFVRVEGTTNSWGAPTWPDGVYIITETGRAVLSAHP